MTTDLAGISAFLSVAETCSFREAGERLGTTRSAVSQAVRRLEQRLDVALVHRTTRSVSLTEAGERLHARIAPALGDIASAMDEAGATNARPAGQLRLAVSSIAERFLAGDLLASFLTANPAVSVDIFVSDEEFDIVALGYDAGVRLGEVLDQDMIAVSVSDEQRQMVVAAPAYLERCGAPERPDDLAEHCCIGWRPGPAQAPYKWEFTRDGRDVAIAVQPRLTTNDMGLMLRTALSGGGLTFGLEETFSPWLRRGELVPLLQNYCPPFPGFFLYFPSRRHLSPKLRVLVDHMRYRGPASAER